MSDRIDFDALRSALANCAESVARHLLPDGRKNGTHFWTAGDVQGNPGNSLKVTIKGAHAGRWKDWATDQDGDLIDLWALKKFGRADLQTRVEAAREAITLLRSSVGLVASPARQAPAPRVAEGPTPDQIERQKRAHQIWLAAKPIRGSKAETYLLGRGLLLLDDFAALRYSREHYHSPGTKFPAMIAAVVDRDGAFLGVHQTFVAKDGHGKAKIEPAKKMLGPIKGGAVRLGPIAPKIAVAEGIETSLAVQNATGLTVWAALSAPGIANLEIPDGIAEVVVCADNDASNVGIEAANKLAERLHSRGIIVRVTMPRKAETDFAKVLEEHGEKGAKIICALVDGAPAWKSAEPSEAPSQPVHLTKYLQAAAPTYADTGLPLGEAHDELKGEIYGFFSFARLYNDNQREEAKRQPGDGIRFNPTTGTPAPVLALRVGVGLGKTECSVRGLTELEFINDVILYLVPTHKLAAEIVERGNALSARLYAETGKAHPIWVHWKGRGREFAPGVPMCQRYDVAKLLEAVGVSVERTLCKRTVNTGEPRIDDPTKMKKVDIYCPFHPDNPRGGGDCPYQKQVADKRPRIIVAANQLAFIENSGLPEPLLTVLDESFWQASIDGRDNDEDGRSVQKLFVGIEAIEHEWPKNVEKLEDRTSADDAHARFMAAIKDDELTVAALMKAGLTADLCREAAKAWRADMEACAVIPTDAVEAVAAKVDAYELGRGFLARKMWRLWWLLSREIAIIEDGSARDDIRSVRLVSNKKRKGGGQGVHLAWSRDFADKVAARPVLMCDATLEPEINERFFPQGIRIKSIEAEWRHVTVTQFEDAPTAKTKLVPRNTADPKTHAENQAAAERKIDVLRAALDLIGARIPEGGPRGLFISNKDVIAAIQAHGGRGPVRNMDAVHFNALAGLDNWRNAPEIVVIGGPLPSTQNLEAVSRAFFAFDPRPIAWLPADQASKRLPNEPRAIRMRDGSAPIVRVPFHPDPLVSAALRAIYDGELIQGIGRGRPSNRTADNPLRITVLGGATLSMTVDRLLKWDDFKPGPVAVAWGRVAPETGVLPLAAAWLVEHHQGLFPSERTAKRHLADYDARKCHPPYKDYIGEMALSAEYRLEGQDRWSRALIRANHPAPQGALAEAVGGPVKFRWVDAPSPPGGALALAAPDPAPADAPAAGAVQGASEPERAPVLIDALEPRVEPKVIACGRALPPTTILIHPTAKEVAAIAPAETRARVGAVRFEAWHGQDGTAELVTIRRPGVKTAPEKGKILPERNAPMDKPQTELRPLARLVFNDASAPGWLRTAVAKGELGHRTRYLFEPAAVLAIAENEAEPAPLRIEAAAEVMRAWRRVASAEEQEALWRQQRPAIDVAKIFILREGVAACDRRDARARGEVVEGDERDDAETLRCCAQIMREPRATGGGARA